MSILLSDTEARLCRIGQVIDVGQILWSSGCRLDGPEIVKPDHVADYTFNVHGFEPLPRDIELGALHTGEQGDPDRFPTELHNPVRFLKVCGGQPECSETERPKHTDQCLRVLGCCLNPNIKVFCVASVSVETDCITANDQIADLMTV